MQALANPWLVGAAGAAFNCGIMVANVGFTEVEALARPDALFSRDGQVSVLLWGAAYLAAGTHAKRGDATWLVFALEKLFYVVRYAQWHSRHSVLKLYADARKSGSNKALLVPLFYAAYGTGDALFGLLFLRLWLGAP
jgi:hypothetical protein